MPLSILVPMVVLGIAAIVLAIHLTGGTRDARLAGAEEARDRFLEDHPDAVITAVALTADRRTAFLDCGGGQVGMVQGFGDRFLTRLVPAGDIVIERAGERGVTVRMNDFTWRGGTFAFADGAEADRVLALLKGAEREAA